MWPVAGFGMDSISKLVINFEILANAEMPLSLHSSIPRLFAGFGRGKRKVTSFQQEDKQSRLSGMS